jgi:hypothetical protein
MTTNILETALALPDNDLLARVDRLAANERDATVELVAHLAALELRPSLFAALGYGSLYAYCTQALRLSEDAACNRIDAARICRRFPGILDLLASGAVRLSTIRLLKPHLTAENEAAVLARASHLRKKEVEALIAELAPRPDVPASVRMLPMPRANGGSQPGSSSSSVPRTSSSGGLFEGPETLNPSSGAAPVPATSPAAVSTARPAKDRPIVQALAPRRYRVQFTMGKEAHADLECVQALLRREIPNGDVAVIFERALRLLREKVEKAKMGVAARPRTRRPSKPVIRPGADKDAGLARREPASRHIPSNVKRAVWWRDAGQCAFVSDAGLRCSERTFLELHHIQPFALDGPTTIGNIALRCRRHNQYEAELVFGSGHQ